MVSRPSSHYHIVSWSVHFFYRWFLLWAIRYLKLSASPHHLTLKLLKLRMWWWKLLYKCRALDLPFLLTGTIDSCNGVPLPSHKKPFQYLVVVSYQIWIFSLLFPWVLSYYPFGRWRHRYLSLTNFHDLGLLQSL